MNKSIWWLLLPLTVSLAVFGVFFVLFPDRIVADRTLLASVVLVSISAGVLLFVPMATRGASPDAGWAWLFSIPSIVSAVLVVIAGTGMALAVSGMSRGAMALDIVTVAGFAVMFIVMRATSTGSGRRSGVSSHVIWADRLEGIAKGCMMPHLRPKLLKLAGETRFLADDNGAVTTEINMRIAGLLDSVAESVNRRDEQSASVQLKRLRNLFSERETELLNLKSRGYSS